MCYFLGKRSDGFQLFLTRNKQDQNLRLSKLISREKDTKVYVKKELVITSSNSNKNEKCGGGKEEANFDFTVRTV